MTIEQLEQELNQPITIGERAERWEQHAMFLSRELAEARYELLRARGQSMATQLPSEDRRRVQLDFDTKEQARQVELLEGMQYNLNRRIEMIREAR